MCPDIAMCSNDRCPSSERCYRFKAKPDEYSQSYMDFHPVQDEEMCSDFYPVAWDDKYEQC